MKSKFSFAIRFIGICCLGIIILQGCKKEEMPAVPPLAHFIPSVEYVTYYVRDDVADSFTVQVGTSDVAGTDRTVAFNVTSPSGAVGGTDYTILSPASGNNVTIAAGTALSSIKLKGNFSSYATGDQDTLVFTLAQSSVPVAKFKDTLKVILKRYCNVNPADMLGIYANAFDTQAGSPNYGPYTVEITSGAVTATGATTGYIMVANFWDVGGPDTRINLDWTDPANFKTSVPAQFLYNDGTYGPATVSGVGNGSFSSCDNTFRISYTVTVAAGSFGNFITTIAR